MDDLISRQAAIDAVRNFEGCENGYSDTYDKAFIISALEELPSAELDLSGYSDRLWRETYEQGKAEAERKTGKWIQNDNGTWSCDQCQSWIPDEQHYYARYCLYCGAKMEGEKK